MKSSENKRVLLRPMGLSDLERIAPWFSDFDDISLFDRNLPIPVNPEYVLEKWKLTLGYSDPPRAFWFLAEDAENVPVGICGLHSINYIHGDAIIPTFVSKKLRGSAISTGMSACVLDLAFDHLRLRRLTTFFREDHPVSKNITERLGFVEEGRLREAWYSEGTHKDVVQIGLLKADWFDIRDQLKAELQFEGKMTIEFRTPLD